MDIRRWISSGLIAIGAAMTLIAIVALAGGFGQGDDAAQPTEPPPADQAAATEGPTDAATTDPDPPTDEATAGDPSPDQVDAEELIPRFFDELSAALTDGDVAWLVEHLHPAVIDRYGRGPCQEELTAVSGRPIRLQATAIAAPTVWQWETDGLVTQIDDAYRVTVEQTFADQTTIEAHTVIDQGQVRWFTDCGEPQ